MQQRVYDIGKLEEAEYNDARRSMRLWPIPDGDETVEKATRDFFSNVLEIPRITVARICIDFVRRVSGTRRSRVENEVLVRFVDVADRDAVQSYAPNLAKWTGKAGIRLEIPTHLRPTFRLLDNHSSELKKKYVNAKRSMKFEDSTRSLVLDVKINDDDGWFRVDHAMAEMARSHRGQEQRQTIGRATPGGKAGRRALLMPSPDKGARDRTGFTAGRASEWTRPDGNAQERANRSHHNSETRDWDSGSSSRE